MTMTTQQLADTPLLREIAAGAGVAPAVAAMWAERLRVRLERGATLEEAIEAEGQVAETVATRITNPRYATARDALKVRVAHDLWDEANAPA